MAKFTKWADRIGETKEVQGVTFTIVGNEGDTVIVEAGDDLHFMSRATWRNGKFTKILRVLKPKYLEFLGKKVRINDILFTVVEAAKEYVRIVAEGYEGEEIITTSRWQRAKFATKKFMQGFKRVMVNCVDLIITNYKAKQEKVKGALREDVESFRSIGSLNELKKLYRRLSKKYHPDMGGNEVSFNAIKKEYEKCKTMLEAMVEKASFKTVFNTKQDWYNFRARYGC